MQKDVLEQLVTDRTVELQQANLKMGQEIAERQRVQRALADSEARFRIIIQEAAIGMAVVDKQGRLTESNVALQKMLGYSAEQLQNMVTAQITHPEDLAQSGKLFEELLQGNERASQIEERFIRSDGTVVWGRLSISLVRDAAGQPLFVIAMMEDISQRREAEEKVSNYREQLQSLSLELSLTEERQKRRLAIDLHDHIGQALAVSKIKLGILQKTAASEDIVNQLNEVQELVEQMIRDTRSLTFELSLPVLYELGFEPAVEWLAQNMFKQHGIVVQVANSGQPMPLNI
jgi:PAS domain S-box-containing protein